MEKLRNYQDDLSYEDNVWQIEESELPKLWRRMQKSEARNPLDKKEENNIAYAVFGPQCVDALDRIADYGGEGQQITCRQRANWVQKHGLGRGIMFEGHKNFLEALN